MGGIQSRSSFTLIELLIVIAIVAVFAVVVVLTLNPAQLLKQARDSNRLSDLQTLNKALSIYETDTLGIGSLGQASTTYFSLIDLTATTTTGTNCQGVGLTPPTGWTYRCAASSTYRKVDGTGWIPVNFSQVSSGSPLGQLPVDPRNTTSTAYYSYTPGASWALSSLLESQKYLQAQAKNDGGYNPGKYELGSSLSLLPQSEGLVGWWKLDETSGTLADSSGNGSNGTQSGGVTYGAAGKVGTALSFDGVDDYVNVGNGSSLAVTTGLTLSAWIKTSAVVEKPFLDNKAGGYNGYALQQSSGNPTKASFSVAASAQDGGVQSSTTINDNVWHLLVGTFNSGAVKIYVDGQLDNANTLGFSSLTAPTLNTRLGEFANGNAPYNGVLDDVRIYNRALSAAEIQAIYDATK